jgi:hypothetical protein
VAVVSCRTSRTLGEAGWVYHSGRTSAEEPSVCHIDHKSMEGSDCRLHRVVGQGVVENSVVMAATGVGTVAAPVVKITAVNTKGIAAKDPVSTAAAVAAKSTVAAVEDTAAAVVDTAAAVEDTVAAVEDTAAAVATKAGTGLCSDH